ncbi:hypothetical protein QFC20_007706 [Naganishia adeliensis]|uniref:Uncharacterized protein n=1 Tax=Naganishia adeliensis TaxID=92952 RepID=A0ACC2UXX1_9TREE|nr:hypothetical protein QFC20_007706 [Naganishia adeliensis]
MHQLEISDTMKAMKPGTGNIGMPLTLTRDVVYVLDAYQPGWAQDIVDKGSFNIDKLGDHEFWVQLYDLLWRCVVEADIRKELTPRPIGCIEESIDEEWLLVEVTESVAAEKEDIYIGAQSA